MSDVLAKAFYNELTRKSKIADGDCCIWLYRRGEQLAKALLRFELAEVELICIGKTQRQSKHDLHNPNSVQEIMDLLQKHLADEEIHRENR